MSVTALKSRAVAEESKSPVEEAIGKFYDLVKASIGLLGGVDQAADVMKIDRGDLNRALNRNGRYLTADHIMRLSAELSELDQHEAAARLIVAFVAPANLLVMPRTQMTMAEMEDRLMAWLRRCPNGDLLIYQALGSLDPRVQTTAAERVRLLKAKVLEFPLGEDMLRQALATPAPVMEVA